MKYIIIAFIASIAGLTNNGQAQNIIANADSLFSQGLFSEAEALYKNVPESDLSHAGATLMLGRIALYSNRFGEAETYLKKALSDSTVRAKALGFLAEAYYRQDRFAEAAPYFAEIGQQAKADKLKFFENRAPYFIEGNSNVTEIPFVQTDPLPLIMLTVNGREVMFLIDTGGWELGIDEELAQELGIQFLGEQTATFAGGKTAVTHQGIVDSVKVGSFTIRNVPVNISQAPKRAAQMFQQPIRGVVGTCFLYHFIFTLDYPGGKLVLKKRATGSGKEKIPGINIPFWMAGDHFMVAWGTVNSGRAKLFFIDTGLAGGGFTGTENTIREANIKLGEALSGMGGGGAVQVRPFQVERLTLGKAEERDIPGLFGALPPDFENRFGFNIGGIISHGFFRPYRVTFDFDTMTMTLDRKNH